MKTTLKKMLDAMNTLGIDHDVTVDLIDNININCEDPNKRLTQAGEAYFKDALNLPVEDWVVYSKRESDYDFDNEDSRLLLAWELLQSFAGYCTHSQSIKWFGK